jgi:hypothetical protein
LLRNPAEVHIPPLQLRVTKRGLKVSLHHLRYKLFLIPSLWLEVPPTLNTRILRTFKNVCRQALSLRAIRFWADAWALRLPACDKHYSLGNPISWFFYFCPPIYFFWHSFSQNWNLQPEYSLENPNPGNHSMGRGSLILDGAHKKKIGAKLFHFGRVA